MASCGAACGDGAILPSAYPTADPVTITLTNKTGGDVLLRGAADKLPPLCARVAPNASYSCPAPKGFWWTVKSADGATTYVESTQVFFDTALAAFPGQILSVRDYQAKPWGLVGAVVGAGLALAAYYSTPSFDTAACLAKSGGPEFGAQPCETERLESAAATDWRKSRLLKLALLGFAVCMVLWVVAVAGVPNRRFGARSCHARGWTWSPPFGGSDALCRWLGLCHCRNMDLENACLAQGPDWTVVNNGDPSRAECLCQNTKTRAFVACDQGAGAACTPCASGKTA